MPLVSVIIPVYNTEIYLMKCINSIINQTLKDIEIIIVNDGSTDNSLAIIHSFSDD
ncbi:glycosyltransferase family 2 protein [Providencia hangzhouensis]